jgi:hypothetical protein
MANLSGGEFLNEIYQNDSRLGTLISRIIKAVNQTASSSGVAPVGQSSPPTAPEALKVTAAGELAHIQITHNAPINRGVQYLTEVSTNPQFAQPLIIDHGCSRTSHPINLPTKTAAGATHSYYFRSYSQYHGSPPSDYVVFGGSGSPTPVTMIGSTQMDLLPSTGSGTASPNGSQGGSGLGKVAQRPAQGPKRQV